MAKAKRKSARRCPPCNEATMARSAFSTAIRTGNCSIADRALDKLKNDLSAKYDHMTKGARALAARDLLSKQSKVNSCRDRAESSDANRFNGLRRRRRRR